MAADKVRALTAGSWVVWSRTPGAIEELCEFIQAGGNMGDFAKNRGFNYTTVLKWLRASNPRSELYAYAREERSHALVDEMVSIADESNMEPIIDEETGLKVAVVFDKTAIARNKLRIETRQWYASRLKPKSYGDKIQVDTTVNHKSISDEDLQQKLAALGITGVSLLPEGAKPGT